MLLSSLFFSVNIFAADIDDGNVGVEYSVNEYLLDSNRSRKITSLSEKTEDRVGKADIIWRNSKDGRNWLWTMDGLSISQSKEIDSVDKEWDIAGRGDFNDDGKSDILWHNSRTGLNYLWMMDGSTLIERKAINTVADLDWQIKAVADFNGDSKSDILWHHQITGQTYVYLMDGFQIMARNSVRYIDDVNWQIEATGDVNGDGKNDVIWRHQLTGVNYIWLMDGVTLQKGYVLNTVPNEWDIVGAGDLNGDGYDDIVWRNPIDGRNWAYLMKNGQIETSRQINNVKGAQWQIKSIADFDGDGKADIFWHNQTTGLTYVYLMDGTAITSRGALNTVNSDWQVIGFGLEDNAAELILLSITISSSLNYEERSNIELSSNIQNSSGTVKYSWEQVSGIEITPTSTDQSTLVFSAPEVTQDEGVSFKLTVTDGANSSASDTVDLTIEDVPLGLAINSGFPSALSGHEDDHAPIIYEITSQLDGKVTTVIVFSSFEGNFNIACRDGSPSYYIATENVTNNGGIRYRIGPDETVFSETWLESRDFTLLIPNGFDQTLIQRLYQNWDAVFQYVPFLSRSGTLNLNLTGFPAVIDKTREACNWPEDVFPLDNGWGTTLPIEPPNDAVYAEFTSDFKPFRTLAWRAKNDLGITRLLIKVGDFSGEGECSGTSTITNRFYVRQDDKLVSAVVGSEAKVSCSQPRILVLQGDFDASRAFVLEVYPFHSNALTRITSELSAPDGPFATLTFENE
jgi:hypothetical protein